jgi:hypothetical protein
VSETQGPIAGDLVVRACPSLPGGTVSSGTGPYCVTRYPGTEPLWPEADQLDLHFARGLARVRARQLGVAAWDATNGIPEPIAN